MKKSIFHIVEAFGGGVLQFLVNICRETRDDFDITIVHSIRPDTPKNFRELFDPGVKFIEVPMCRSLSLKRDIAGFLALRNIIKGYKPDIVHLHSSKAGVLGRVANFTLFNNKARQLYYTPHGYSFLQLNVPKAQRRLYWAIEKLSSCFGGYIIACGNDEYKYSLKLSRKALLIRNGIDLESIKRDMRPRNFKCPKICTVGRIAYPKNPYFFNQLALAFPNLSFTWIGDGELRNELTAPNIIVTGWLGHDECIKLLMQSDIFILCSLWEGLALSLLEAMYCGNLCMTNNTPGTSDPIIHGKNGLVFSSLQECKTTIENIMEGKIDCHRLIDTAVNDVRNIYNIKVMAGTYIKLLNNN